MNTLNQVKATIIENNIEVLNESIDLIADVLLSSENRGQMISDLMVSNNKIDKKTMISLSKDESIEAMIEFFKTNNLINKNVTKDALLENVKTGTKAILPEATEQQISNHFKLVIFKKYQKMFSEKLSLAYPELETAKTEKEIKTLLKAYIEFLKTTLNNLF